MARTRTVVIDEVHVIVRIPSDPADDEAEAVGQTLAGDEFTSRLRRAVRAVVRAFAELKVVRVSLTR
jgi:hypothetical protein